MIRDSWVFRKTAAELYEAAWKQELKHEGEALAREYRMWRFALLPEHNTSFVLDIDDMKFFGLWPEV